MIFPISSSSEVHFVAANPLKCNDPSQSITFSHKTSAKTLIVVLFAGIASCQITWAFVCRSTRIAKVATGQFHFLWWSHMAADRKYYTFKLYISIQRIYLSWAIVAKVTTWNNKTRVWRQLKPCCNIAYLSWILSQGLAPNCFPTNRMH